MATNEKSRLATNINKDLHQRFKIQAIREDKKINELLEILIEKYLREKEEH